MFPKLPLPMAMNPAMRREGATENNSGSSHFGFPLLPPIVNYPVFLAVQDPVGVAAGLCRLPPRARIRVFFHHSPSVAGGRSLTLSLSGPRGIPSSRFVRPLQYRYSFAVGCSFSILSDRRSSASEVVRCFPVSAWVRAAGSQDEDYDKGRRVEEH